jgi:hypothetical protein
MLPTISEWAEQASLKKTCQPAIGFGMQVAGSGDTLQTDGDRERMRFRG